MRAYREEEWSRIRERGKPAFLIRHGFLGRGLPLGLIVALAIEATVGGSFPESLREPGFWGRLLFAVAVFTTSGCVTAHFHWRLHERRHGAEAVGGPGAGGGSGRA